MVRGANVLQLFTVKRATVMWEGLTRLTSIETLGRGHHVCRLVDSAVKRSLKIYLSKSRSNQSKQVSQLWQRDRANSGISRKRW